MKPKAIIVDIDGTLSDPKHRLHYVKNPEGKKNFDKFFAEAHKDIPKQDVIDIIKKLGSGVSELDEEGKHYELIFLTGRPEKLRNITMNWLGVNGLLDYSYNGEILSTLYMRPNGNYTPDDELKQRIYEEEIKSKFDVVCVFDDRPRVIRMWHKLGLTTFNCGTGVEF